MNATRNRTTCRLALTGLLALGLLGVALAQPAAPDASGRSGPSGQSAGGATTRPTPTTQAQRRNWTPPVNRELTKQAPAVLSAVRPLAEAAHVAVATVLVDGRSAAFATIVTSEGHLVTKASELPDKGEIRVRLADGRELPATRVGAVVEHDLAMLRVEAGGLTPVRWAEPDSIRVGQVVVSAGPTAEPIGVGVISVGRRPTTGGFLGVTLSQAEDGVRVEAVSPGLPAQRAGIQPGDVIIAINDEKFTEREELSRYLQSQQAGTEVSVTVRRGNEELILRATLARRPAEQSPRSAMQNAMGSTLSARRTDFPVILQHDTVLQNTEQGGPLLDLQGHAIGINIARAGRVETYALPVEVVRGLVAELLAGKHPPAPVPDGRPTDPKASQTQREQHVGELRQTLESLKGRLEQARQADDRARQQHQQARREVLEQLNMLAPRLEGLDPADREALQQAIDQLRQLAEAGGR